MGITSNFRISLKGQMIKKDSNIS